MSKGLLASIAVLLAGAGAALAQERAELRGVAPIGPVAPMGVAGPVMNCCTPRRVNCGAPEPCCAPWYGRAEYLLWWTKGSPVAAPLATSVAPGTPTGGTPIPGAV